MRELINDGSKEGGLVLRVWNLISRLLYGRDFHTRAC